MRARNGRTVLLNLSPNRRRISPVTRSIEISSSPRAAHSVATVSAAGYRPSRSAILKPYSDSLSATHCASTDSAPTLRPGARAGKSSWSMDGVYPRPYVIEERVGTDEVIQCARIRGAGTGRSRGLRGGVAAHGVRRTGTELRIDGHEPRRQAFTRRRCGRGGA